MPLDVREEGLELVVAVPALLQLGDRELLPLREGRTHLDQLVALRPLELELQRNCVSECLRLLFFSITPEWS